MDEAHRNILLCVAFAALKDIPALLHFHINSFETELLPPLLHSIVREDFVEEGVDEMVEPSVPLPLQKFPLEDVMPAGRRSSVPRGTEYMTKHTPLRACWCPRAR